MAKKLDTICNILINGFCYNFVWIICITTAQQDKVWKGFLISFIFIFTQLLFYNYLKKDFKELVKFAAPMILLGFLVDTILINLGVFEFKATIAQMPVASPFLLGIWISFAIMFYSILHIWLKRYLLLSILAGLGFPTAYYLGQKMGAANATYGYYSFLILGIIWLISFPSYIYIYNKTINKN